mgnify:CR=1 FL=1
MKPNKETFCVLPFTMMSTTNSGDFRTCCEGLPLGFSAIEDSIEDVWNSDFYKNLRLDLMNGVRHKNCSQCWRREFDGGYSTRQNENESISQSDYKELINSFDSKSKPSLVTSPFSVYSSYISIKRGFCAVL